jgi:hypothetical protein
MAYFCTYLGCTRSRLPQIDSYEFLTLEPIQPFGALAQQGRDAREGNPMARTGLRC